MTIFGRGVSQLLLKSQYCTFPNYPTIDVKVSMYVHIPPYRVGYPIIIIVIFPSPTPLHHLSYNNLVLPISTVEYWYNNGGQSICNNHKTYKGGFPLLCLGSSGTSCKGGFNHEPDLVYPMPPPQRLLGLGLGYLDWIKTMEEEEEDTNIRDTPISYPYQGGARERE